MKLYSVLSKIGFLRESYARKFLFVAFIGIHVPLIAIIFLVLFYEKKVSPEMIFIVTLTFTLLATAVTLTILKRLIKPIEVASKALDNYRSNRTIPDLPLEFSDQAGHLMYNIQATIKSNEALLKQKQDLAYLLSHDLKNYAENPTMLAKLILEENPSPKVVEYTTMILESAERQNEFIRTFIVLLKEEDNLSKKAIKIRGINFNSVVTAIKEQLSYKLDNKRIKLVTDLQVRDVPLKIEMDMLVKVLVNLVDNAIKFSYPDSEITLSVSKEHAKLQISVSDTGLGFDDTKSNVLFKKFTSLGRVGTANEKSTGIGLYLSNQIIKKSDGTIVAESRGENKGSTFHVNLKAYRRV